MNDVESVLKRTEVDHSTIMELASSIITQSESQIKTVRSLLDRMLSFSQSEESESNSKQLLQLISNNISPSSIITNMVFNKFSFFNFQILEGKKI